MSDTEWPDTTLNITTNTIPATNNTKSANKRRNTVNISELPNTLQQQINSPSNHDTANHDNNNKPYENKQYASNKKLKPNQRMTSKNNNVDQRSIGTAHTAYKPYTTTQSMSAINNMLSSNKPRSYTISIAVPGSIISNCQTSELKTYVAGQIARSIAIYNIDEIIIYNEDTKLYNTAQSSNTHQNTLSGEYESSRSRTIDPNKFLGRILQYLDTPQYLRKSLFPVHPDLKYAGLLNPLDTTHHVRATEDVLYREGITVDKNQRNKVAPSGYTYVNVGLRNCCLINTALKPNVRVTVKINQPVHGSTTRTDLTGTVVSRNEPRELYGLYYGYTVRLAENGINDIFNLCPYDKYDLTIGTSERGVDIHDSNKIDHHQLHTFQHLLIVFGGLSGLEDVVSADQSIDTNNAATIFDLYINTCVNQGSRTIRTEEAIPITMAALQPYINKR